jgi:PAS domain S-box-containing protein
MRAHDEFTANSLYLSDAGVEEKDFDHLTALAAKMCGCTMASISILGSEREYFKSTHGIALIDQPLRDSVFAILNQDSQEFVEVEDIYKDARLSPIAGMGYTSYAAVPVKDASGQTIAALSVMEKKALRLDSAQLANLSVLGCQVGRLFELKAVQSAEIRNRTAATNNSDRLQAIIDSAQLGTWEWHVQTGEVNVNARWAEIAGYTLADLAPIDINTWYRLIHPSDVAKSDAALQACLEGKSAYYDIECRLVHKLGNPIWINDRGRVVNRSSDGKALIMMGTHTDITKRKQTEIQFKAIADNIEGVVFRYQLFPDGSDSLQLVSQGALQIWGYTPEVVMNDIQLIWDRIDSRDLVGLRKSIVLSAEELKRWTYEFRYEHPNGSLIWLKGRGTPIHLEDGSVIWDSVMLDITEEKEAKIKAKEGERLVNESQKLAKLGSWMLDPETEKLIWSEGLYAVFGVDPDTFTASKRALHALIDQADLALLVDANRKILKTGAPL